jgi:hypothetical protein
MRNPILEQRATDYAVARGINLNLKDSLGHGTDGAVWKSPRPSAIKALERRDNYQTELACYQRLREHSIRHLCGFAVPELFDWDDRLLVIEMGIVTPPYLLDFGKAYIDRPPPFSPEQIQESMDEWKENFEDRWPEVQKLLRALLLIGIRYYDPRPGNITFE